MKALMVTSPPRTTALIPRVSSSVQAHACFSLHMPMFSSNPPTARSTTKSTMCLLLVSRSNFRDTEIYSLEVWLRRTVQILAWCCTHSQPRPRVWTVGVPLFVSAQTRLVGVTAVPGRLSRAWHTSSNHPDRVQLRDGPSTFTSSTAFCHISGIQSLGKTVTSHSECVIPMNLPRAASKSYLLVDSVQALRS